MWWTLFTIVLIAAVAWLVFMAAYGKISVRWYEWLIAGVGVVSFVFGLQNLFGGIAEGEPTAGWLLFATFGGIGLILLIVAFVLANSRRKVEV